jgi:hypothetical protein
MRGGRAAKSRRRARNRFSYLLLRSFGQDGRRRASHGGFGILASVKISLHSPFVSERAELYGHQGLREGWLKAIISIVPLATPNSNLDGGQERARFVRVAATDSSTSLSPTGTSHRSGPLQTKFRNRTRSPEAARPRDRNSREAATEMPGPTLGRTAAGGGLLYRSALELDCSSQPRSGSPSI